eukprot:scaffold17_cov354-Pavlova_lutheri.AAC.40
MGFMGAYSFPTSNTDPHTTKLGLSSRSHPSIVAKKGADVRCKCASIPTPSGVSGPTSGTPNAPLFGRKEIPTCRIQCPPSGRRGCGHPKGTQPDGTTTHQGVWCGHGWSPWKVHTWCRIQVGVHGWALEHAEDVLRNEGGVFARDSSSKQGYIPPAKQDRRTNPRNTPPKMEWEKQPGQARRRRGDVREVPSQHMPIEAWDASKPFDVVAQSFAPKRS